MSSDEFNRIITKEQCLKLVEKVIKTNQFQLINYSLKPLGGEKNGYLATHLKGKFDIKCGEITQTLNFFMKLKLNNDDTFGKLGNESDVYLCESTFLKLVTNDFDVAWAPKFYDFIDNKLLVLEDLSEGGYKVADLEAYDLNHCYIGLKALASFHAFSFKFLHDKRLENAEYSILKEHPYFFKDYLYTNQTELSRKFTKAAKGSMLCVIDKMQPNNYNHIKLKLSEIFDDLIEELKPKENKHRVISHGDLWVKNIMFSYENDVPKQCCMVDFQNLRYMSPTFDLQFFLSVNTSTSFREEHFSELLDYYYQQLSQELKLIGLDSNEIYAEETFKKSCTNTILFAVTLACSCKTCYFYPLEKYHKYLLDPVISEEMVYGNRAKYIKEELEINDIYKDNVFREYQILIDLIEKLL